MNLEGIGDIEGRDSDNSIHEMKNIEPFVPNERPALGELLGGSSA
jgi:hypothetical protein